uniref:Uncharacterized protein n=1 Tax=Anguilla anguilla TaxID=7936 RepID=A0A0E9QY92_ANGAN
MKAVFKVPGVSEEFLAKGMEDSRYPAGYLQTALHEISQEVH